MDECISRNILYQEWPCILKKISVLQFAVHSINSKRMLILVSFLVQEVMYPTIHISTSRYCIKNWSLYSSCSSFIDISTLSKNVNNVVMFKDFGFQLTYNTRDLAAFCYLVRARWILRRTALTSPWKHLFCVSATESSTCFTISLNSSSRLYFIVREVSKYWQLWISATRIASERKT